MPFTFKPLKIKGLLLIETKVFSDNRGFFAEVYKFSEFKKAGIPSEFKQCNHSLSAKNVVRGLHYQKNPNAQGKLVRVLTGKIFDVAVDIRKGSPTYGKWEGIELDAKSKQMLYIPEGFAHGFLTLVDNTEVEYFCTKEYSVTDERGIRFDDPVLGINWPLHEPSASPKDAINPLFRDAENNFVYGG